MKTIRAKFECSNVEVHEEAESKTAHLHAVHEGEENKVFTKYTPGGNLTITITKEAPAVDFFQHGKTYFLDFTEVKE